MVNVSTTGPLNELPIFLRKTKRAVNCLSEVKKFLEGTTAVSSSAMLALRSLASPLPVRVVAPTSASCVNLIVAPLENKIVVPDGINLSKASIVIVSAPAEADPFATGFALLVANAKDILTDLPLFKSIGNNSDMIT